MLTNPDCAIKSDGFINPSLLLNDVLRFTLPSLEASETTAGLSNDELFKALLVNKQQQLPFLLSEISKLNAIAGIKDHFFEGLDLYVNIEPRNKLFSQAFNRITVNNIFFHQDLKKKFNHEILFETEIPFQKKISALKQKQAIRVIKNSMVLTVRETDPSTYMDESSFKIFELERGITIAIYGMVAQRQLPLESYIGFTLFKNGFPASYGGSWVFGEHALFGINIFEEFRGGESGYLMCQLLRLYHQIFKISYFEVEPYQFGLENPEGIESGAFWFYYRYGFRPLNGSLLNIALKENKKIMTVKGYRTKKTILLKFTESNLVLRLGQKTPVKVIDITTKVKEMIKYQYQGNRLLAETSCVHLFLSKTKPDKKISKNEKQVLKEVALWSEAIQLKSKNKLDLLTQMIYAKPKDLYQYQTLLLQFFNK